VTNSDLIGLFDSKTEMTPRDIVRSFSEDAFQEVANTLWHLVDKGELEITKNKTLRRVEDGQE